MLLTEVWVAIELFVVCRWSRSPWRIPLTAVRGVRTGKLEMVHHFASCKEQACQEGYDASASLDDDRSTMLTWLLLRRMPTRRWAPAHHRVDINGGQSPEQLYVTCAHMYCLVIQLIHMMMIPKVKLQHCCGRTILCWLCHRPFRCDVFVFDMPRVLLPACVAIARHYWAVQKKKQLVKQECERQKCEWHQCAI